MTKPFPDGFHVQNDHHHRMVILHYITVTILIESQQPAQPILNQLLSALTLLDSPRAFRIFAFVRGYYDTLGCQSQIIARILG